MHDLNAKNVIEDPVQVPDQLDEIVPLTPVQILFKEEVVIPDQLGGEVVPLRPVQIFIKEEVSSKTEEPVLVSLVPLLPKEESVVHALPDDFEDDSSALVINLENSSSEEWSNQSDPLAIEPNEAEVSYAEYVENTDAILLDLGATSTEGALHTLRVAQEATSAADSAELYDLFGSDGVVRGSENGSASPDGDSECESADAPPDLTKRYRCGLCGAWFTTEGEMQMDTLSHVGCATARRPKPEPRPKPELHACRDCDLSFDRLELLLRHRLGHIRTPLSSPLSAPKPVALPQVADSRRKAASPKRNAQRSAITPQSKRWGRRKKTHRRRVS